jgi:hypothetical protein
MIDRLGRYLKFSILAHRMPSVGVPIISGEIAARDFNQDLMALKKYVADRPQIDVVVVNFARSGLSPPARARMSTARSLAEQDNYWTSTSPRDNETRSCAEAYEMSLVMSIGLVMWSCMSAFLRAIFSR